MYMYNKINIAHVQLSASFMAQNKREQNKD